MLQYPRTYKFQMVANAITRVVKLIPMLTVAAVKSITKTVIQRHPRDSIGYHANHYCMIILCGYICCHD